MCIRDRDVTAAVEQLLGLSYDQFTQIAMIAQGDFQKLLLAGTTQRGEIFRQLFHTGLYQQIQMKLKDASIARYKEYDEMRRSIAQYLDEMCIRDSHKGLCGRLCIFAPKHGRISYLSTGSSI